MTYHIVHWIKPDLLGEVAGVYQPSDNPDWPGARPTQLIDIEDEAFGGWIKEMIKKYDVMVREVAGPTTVIFLDDKGRRFSQR